MMREVMKSGVGIFILLLVGLGCGVTKPAWLPWGNNPAPATLSGNTGSPSEQPPTPPTSALPPKTLKPSEQPPTPPTSALPPKTLKPTGQPPTPPAPVLPPRFIRPSNHKQPGAGDAIAQYNLALQLEAAGKLPEAAALYQKAADQKLREAEYNVGYMYAHGEGLPQSDVNAELWFRRAAEQGLDVAQHMMGFIYADGRGVPQNFEKSVDWHHKAAEQGLASAQSHLGYLYAVGGKIVKRNPTEACKWFLRAAENGEVDAQFQIGVFLARGDGVEQDVVEGYKWLNLASLGSHEGAKTARAELLKQMRPDAVTEAQKRSGEYIARQRQK